MRQRFPWPPIHLPSILLSALSVGCASGSSERIDTTSGETTEETDPVETQPPGDGSSTEEPAPSKDPSTPTTSDSTSNPSPPPNPTSEGTDVPSPSATVAPDAGEPISEPTEPLCDEDEFYCNGACLSELGERVNGCRIVYVSTEPGPFGFFLMQYRGGLLLPHAGKIVALDRDRLSARTIVDGFDDIHWVQLDDDLLYVAGVRSGINGLWIVPMTGGELTSLGLDGQLVEWFEIYRSRLYHRISIERSVSEMRVLDLETGVSTALGIPSTTFAFSGDYAYYWVGGKLLRSPVAAISTGGVEFADPGSDAIRRAYATESDVYWFTGSWFSSTPTIVYLWGLDTSVTEPRLITELPPSTWTSFYNRSGNRLLVSTSIDAHAVTEFWTLPLDGDSPLAVSELDWLSAEYSHHYNSELTPTHVYHSVEGTHASVVLEVELPNPE